MSKPYKYDIAISFAEEDGKLAEELHEALESYAFKYKTYFYKKKQGEQVGKKLHKIIQEVYGGQSKYAIVLVSKFYHTKEWTQREWEVIEDEREKRKGLYRILISLDGTILNAMDRKELHIPSDKSAERIAMTIHEVIDRDRPSLTLWKVALIAILGLAFIVLVSGWVTVSSSPPFLHLPAAKEQPVIIDSTDIKKEKRTTPTIPKTTDLTLTRSEKYQGMNVYVNKKKVAVFSEYMLILPDLTAGDEVSIGTDGSREFILTINKTHLENESFEHFIE